LAMIKIVSRLRKKPLNTFVQKDNLII